MNGRSTLATALVALLIVSTAAGVLPVRAQAAAASGTAFVQAEANAYYSVALRADGSVWTWGRNLLSELGVQKKRTVGRIGSPTRLAGLSGITEIAADPAGGGYQLAVKRDGTVWEWGADGIMAGLLPRQKTGIEGAVHVASTSKAGFALLRDGSVRAWPRPVTGAGEEARSPLSVAGLPRIAALASAGSFVYGVGVQGEVWCIPIGAEADRLQLGKPYPIEGLPALKKISASPDIQLGLDAGGQVWRWKPEDVRPSGGGVSGTARTVQATKVHPGLKIADIGASRQYALLLAADGRAWVDGVRLTGKGGWTKGLPPAAAVTAGLTHALAIDRQGRLWGWGSNQWQETGTGAVTPDSMVYSPRPVQEAVTMKLNGALLPGEFPVSFTPQGMAVPIKMVIQAAGGSMSVASGSDPADGREIITLRYGAHTAVFRSMDQRVEVDGAAVLLPDRIYSIPGALTAPPALFRLLGLGVQFDEAAQTLQFHT